MSAQYEGEALNTGFNARYLLDVFDVMDGEKISLQMDSALSPCLIQEAETPGFKCVVMPIKICRGILNSLLTSPRPSLAADNVRGLLVRR